MSTIFYVVSHIASEMTSGSSQIRSRDYNFFSCSTQLVMKILMLISIKIPEIQFFSGSDNPIMLFFLLINIEMATNFGILTFMSWKKIMLS